MTVPSGDNMETSVSTCEVSSSEQFPEVADKPKRNKKSQNKEHSTSCKINCGKSLNPAYHRVNFLYQAAFMLNCNSENSSELSDIAQFYSSTLIQVAEKAQVKLHPSLKRTICKKCRSVLVAGISSKVSYEGKQKNKSFVIKCNRCGTIKRFLTTNSEYKIWFERMEEEETSENVLLKQ